MRPDDARGTKSERALRILAAAGALACGLAVAAGAYVMHAAIDAHAKEWLAIAALFGFAHGLALAAIAPAARNRRTSAGCWILASGTLLFSGSLAGAALFGMPTTVAPIGGTLLIAGWLVVAAGLLSD